MKLETSSHELLAQLQTATRVASTRSAVQALSGVQLAAEGGRVEIRATDMEVALRVPLQATIVREGTVVLPARLLLDVVRQLPAGDVSLELRPAEQDVEVVSGPARFHLRTLRAEDFPNLPEPGGDQVVDVPAQAFVETIAMVARSASRDETRPILTGILVTAEGDELKMVATDSYRLSVKETKLEAPLSSGFEANVPARALQELERIVAQTSEEQIRIGVRANQVVFEVAGVVLSSRLIEGQFPNYRQLLPEGYEHELRMSGEELAGVVRRISLMAQKNAPLRLSFGEGELTVSAQTPDVGEASEPLPAPFAGEPFEIGFNPDFLRDGLESAGAGDLILKLISPLRPGLIESGDGSGFLYLIMPIRLNV
ncbi:MAG: DNA polymerase III subunit beta [Solirubrobacteraceae bacterium]